MIAVPYPEPRFRIKNEGTKPMVYDAIRKTWVPLTQEEWVRQNFISYLTATLQYPSTLIAVEKEIWLHDLKKRFDILVYDRQHRPWMLVECKAPQVALGEDILQQALRYHLSTPVSYLVLTNGPQTIGWKKEEQGLVLLQELPAH